ncbi:hypothetical protein DES53_115116 [Roseimicrobium gellanilyticum]|uniref:Uncharacterized protein n=2 Tax=Roseimicrobium gellanilyticum TaxID=748857 RepID=A0A366H4N5_9BACT|nr:hypothetical protein DES53_115116 [Roseimicrobium gellanilyticum]
MACVAFWTVIVSVVMFRAYSLFMLPALLRFGMPRDLSWWTEPFVIEEMQESGALIVLAAAICVFPWNDKLSFWGIVFMLILWLATPYRLPG